MPLSFSCRCRCPNTLSAHHLQQHQNIGYRSRNGPRAASRFFFGGCKRKRRPPRANASKHAGKPTIWILQRHTSHLVSHNLPVFFYRLALPHFETNGRVKTQRHAARGDVGRAENNAHLTPPKTFKYLPARETRDKI